MWGLREEFQPEWHDDWKQYYCDSNEVTDPSQIQAAYTKVMNEFAANIGVSSDGVEAVTFGVVPRNIR
jgi:hypothetical protein